MPRCDVMPRACSSLIARALFILSKFLSGHFLGMFNMEPRPWLTLETVWLGQPPFFNSTSLRKRRQKTKMPSKQADTEYQRARDRAFYGSLGAASPVRRIDPKTGNVIALIDPKTGATLPKKR